MCLPSPASLEELREGKATKGEGGKSKLEMKSRWESEEAFAKYAELEAIEWLIRKEYETITKARPRTGIEIMVDKATGFDKERNRQLMAPVAELLGQKIACEKFLGLDSSHAEEFLAKLVELDCADREKSS